MRNNVMAASGRFMPHEWLTRISGRLLRPAAPPGRHGLPPADPGSPRDSAQLQAPAEERPGGHMPLQPGARFTGRNRLPDGSE